MSSFELIEKHVLSDNEHYTAILDEFRCPDGAVMCLLHLDVWDYSHNALKKMRKEWEVLRDCLPFQIFATEPEPNDPKWERFARSFGFQYLCDMGCNDGLFRRAFISNPPAPN